LDGVKADGCFGYRLPGCRLLRSTENYRLPADRDLLMAAGVLAYGHSQHAYLSSEPSLSFLAK